MPQETTATAKTSGFAFVAAGAIGFSTIIIFTRSITGITSPSIAFFRALASFFFFCALLPWFPQTRHVRRYRHEIGWLVGLGLAVGLTGMLYIEAVQYTTAANAVLLNNTSTVYVALIAPWLLREARPRYTWISLALAIVGIACIANPAELSLASGGFRGIVAGALSGTTYSMTMLLSRRLRGRVSGVTQIWWSTGIAALLSLPWAFQTPWNTVARNLPYLIALGVVAQGIPYMLYFLGLERVQTQIVSIVALLEPVGGILIGILLYHEIPNATGVLGIVLVLTSIILVSR